jgi:hypothetical protein
MLDHLGSRPVQLFKNQRRPGDGTNSHVPSRLGILGWAPSLERPFVPLQGCCYACDATTAPA